MAIQSLESAQSTMASQVWAEQPAANANLLQAVASARFGLVCAAEHICEILRPSIDERGDKEGSVRDQRALNRAKEHLQFAAKEICEQCPEDMLKLFLMKLIVRKVGLDTFRQAMENTALGFNWVMPKELLENSEEAVPDRFIVHEEPYRGIREAFAGFVLSADLPELEKATKHNQRAKRSVSAVTALATYREVTMRSAEASVNRHINQPTLIKLDEFTAAQGRFQDNVRTLVGLFAHNRQGENFAEMRVSPAQNGTVRSMSALVIHYITVVMHTAQHNRLLDFLAQLAFNPANMTKSFFPTMPEDFLQDARQAIGGAWYECPNGHPYYVSECGQPMQSYTCPDCGAHIGGGHHRLYDTNKRARDTDTSQTGHILGPANQRSRTPVPERDLPAAATALLRLFIDASLLWSSSSGPDDHRQAVVVLTHPNIPAHTVSKYYWQHLDHDIQVFSAAIGKGVDEGLVAVHQIFKHILDIKPHDGRGLDLRLASRATRRRWEDAFNREVIQPCLANIGDEVQRGLDLIVNDTRLGNDPLMQAVFEVDTEPFGETRRGYLSAPLWRYRVLVSVEHLAHTLKSSAEYPILSAFLKHEPHLRAVQYLPDIVKLQRILVDRFSRRIDRGRAQQMSISTFLNQLPDKMERQMFEQLIESFNAAWTLVREAILQRSRLRPEPNAHFRQVTRQGRLAFILPTTKGYGRCATSLVDFLVTVQNDFLLEYFGLLEETTAGAQHVSVLNATRAQLIAFDSGRHLLPLVLAHCNYTLEIGEGTNVHYNWASLEKQLEQRFIVGRPFVDAEEIRVVFSEDVQNMSDMSSLRQLIPQKDLASAVQRQIIGELLSLPDVCKVIAALEIAIGFLAVSGGSGDMLLSEYMENVLKMQPMDHLISPKLLQTCRLYHLIALWRLASVERARRLTASGQDAFEHIKDAFKEDLSRGLRNGLTVALRSLSRDVFVAELLEYMSIKLSKEHGEDQLGWEDLPISEALDMYQSEKGVVIDGLDALPDQLELRHAASAWMFAVQNVGQAMRSSQFIELDRNFTD